VQASGEVLDAPELKGAKRSSSTPNRVELGGSGSGTGKTAPSRSAWSWPKWLPWLLMGVVLATALTVGILDNNDSPTQAERANALARTIRCPQCQGETVAESNVALAATIRADIRQKVDAGESDREIRQGYVDLYGESVLLTPPSDGFGSVLWIAPIVAVATAAAAIWVAWRQRVQAGLAAATAAGSQTAEPKPQPGLASESGSGSGISTGYLGKAGLWMGSGRWRAYAAVAIVVVVAVVAGLFLARSVGFRSSSDEITGDIRQSSGGLLVEAGELAAEGDFSGAIQTYDRILSSEPSNVVALGYKGWLIWLSSESAEVRGTAAPELALVDLGEFESHRLLSEAIASDPAYADARVFLAIIYANVGRWRQSAEQLVEFYALDPPANIVGLVDNPVRQGELSIREQILVGLQDEAVSYIAEGQADEALMSLEALLELEPDNVVALSTRGTLLTLPELVEFKDIFTRGLEDLDRAASLSPDNPQVRLRRAQALIVGGLRLEQAEADLELILNSDASQEVKTAAESLRSELADVGAENAS